MLKAILSAAVCLGLTCPALSQTANPLPQGTITFIVPLAAGGPADVTARVLSDYVGSRTSRVIVVENKTGAAGNIGASAVAQSPANGSAWLYTVDSVVTINPLLTKALTFNATTDLVAVAQVGSQPLILAVNPTRVPVNSFAGLLAYSKLHPLNFGSSGIGSPGHLAFELLKMKAGISGAHVPYRGAAGALNDLLGGQIEVAFIAAGALLPHVKSGKLRALAISSSTRSAMLPDVPTAAEAGIKDFNATFANYILAPAATPANIIDFMALQIKDFLAQPDVQRRFDELFIEPTYAGPAEAQKKIVQDREKWGRVIALIEN